jgi:hypothetical protein
MSINSAKAGNAAFETGAARMHEGEGMPKE